MSSYFSEPSHHPPTPEGNNLSSFQIRVALPSDISTLTQIIAECFQSPNSFWAWTYPILNIGIYEDLRGRICSTSPYQVCLVAVDALDYTTNNLAGTVELSLRINNPWLQTRFPYLSNLAVRPQYRRQGAAKQLLLKSEQIAVAWGFKDLYLHVLENNDQAKQLYFKLGYKVQKIEDNWLHLLLGRPHQLLLHKQLKAK